MCEKIKKINRKEAGFTLIPLIPLFIWLWIIWAGLIPLS